MKRYRICNIRNVPMIDQVPQRWTPLTLGTHDLTRLVVVEHMQRLRQLIHEGTSALFGSR